MSKFDELDQLVEKGNGYLVTADVVESGISKPTLAQYVKQKEMERVAHGIYLSKDAWPDSFYQLYLRSRRIVFSFDSALYLHGMTDREPFRITVTTPAGYNDTHLKKEGIKVVHAIPEWYDLGRTTIKTNYGNEVPVYDRERCICDIIRNKSEIEIQTFQTAMKEYMYGKGKNLMNLMKYAEAFGIQDRVRLYTEVML